MKLNTHTPLAMPLTRQTMPPRHAAYQAILADRPRFGAEEDKKKQSWGEWWTDVKKGAGELTTQTGWQVKNWLMHATKPSTPLKDAVFTIFDLETTGLDANKDSIIELAAIKYRNGEEVDRLVTMVKPTGPLNPEAQKVNNITEEMVKDAPDIKTVLDKFVTFVGPQPLLTGHFVNFDINFVKTKLDQNGMGQYQDRFNVDKAFCTKTLSQMALQNLPKYSGVEVAKVLGIENDRPHRAEDDVKMTGEILYKLIERLKSRNFETVSDLRGYQGKPISEHNGKPDRLKKITKP